RPVCRDRQSACHGRSQYMRRRGPPTPNCEFAGSSVPCGPMSYVPIEDYGLIGNMHTAALVGRNGSIDWLCLPNFDSPSVFAAILDDRKGGYFRVAPVADCNTRKQLYWPETNILITRFLCDAGVV